MRRPFYRVTEDDDTVIDLTPMLDIVFIMLIFFVVTASSVKETGIDINRPTARTAVTKDSVNLKVVISEYDEIWVDKRRVDVRALQPLLERMHIENPQSALIIHADKKSTNNRLVQVMDAAREVGIDSVSIAAVEQ
ncbi:MAG: biopolymer transporter ExbD [Gammaproteobacteria bacterium]|jgi:biopolymer transport protein ExbD|nr:biopolymer transporter ExbD [Gammaproteobacteria bacterium]